LRIEVYAMTDKSDGVIKVYKKVDSECRAMTSENLREVSKNLREIIENLRVQVGVY